MCILLYILVYRYTHIYIYIYMKSDATGTLKLFQTTHPSGQSLDELGHPLLKS